MKTEKKKAAQICRRNCVKLRCSNICGDNEVDYCDYHYKIGTDFLNKEKELPPEEQRCILTDRKKWRCKNFRMMMNDGISCVPNIKFCQKHYTYYLEMMMKRRNRDGDGNSKRRKKKTKKKINQEDDRSVTSTSYYSENHSKRRNKVDDETEFTDLQSKKKKKKPPPPDEERCCCYRKCKKFRMINVGAEDITGPSSKYCEKHYKMYTDFLNDDKEKENLPTDELRCCERNSAMLWRCKNFRMNDDTAVPDSKYCEKHYILNKIKINKQKRKYKEKKNLSLDELGCFTTAPGTQSMDSKRRNTATEDDGTSIQPSSPTSDKSMKSREFYSNCSKRRKKVMADERSIYVTGIQPEATSNNTCESADHSKRRNKVDETEAINHTCDSYRINIQGGSTEVGTKRKNVKRTQENEQVESSARTREVHVVELESQEHYKCKCIELSAELEKKKVECTMLQDKLVEVECRKNATGDETERTPADATEWLRKMLTDLESRVILKMENVNSAFESRLLNLESLVLKTAKESPENIESQGRDLLNDITQSVEKQRDEQNSSKPKVETSSGGRKDSHVYDELNIKQEVRNVYDVDVNKHQESVSEFPSLYLSSRGEKTEKGKGWDYSEQRPCQHISSVSQYHLEMREKPLVNSVSDDDGESSGESSAEDSDTSTDSGGSLGDFMEMLAMKYRNENKDNERKWKFEADMLSSFEEDPELCMKAVCALYRQQMSGAETLANGWFHYRDALRATTLAKFLTDGACKGDLKKSVKELEIFDSEAVEDCKRLARTYSKQLFNIYKNGKDPFFLPAASAK